MHCTTTLLKTHGYQNQNVSLSSSQYLAIYSTCFNYTVPTHNLIKSLSAYALHRIHSRAQSHVGPVSLLPAMAVVLQSFSLPVSTVHDPSSH